MSDFSRHIYALENRLLQPVAQLDQINCALLLHEDFFEQGSHGIINKQQALRWIFRQDSMLEWLIKDFSVQQVTSEVVLASYTSQQKGTNGYWEKTSQRSSLWLLTNDQWQLRFHQGSRVKD